MRGEGMSVKGHRLIVGCAMCVAALVFGMAGPAAGPYPPPRLTPLQRQQVRVFGSSPFDQRRAFSRSFLRIRMAASHTCPLLGNRCWSCLW